MLVQVFIFLKGAYCDSSSQFIESCEKIEEWMLTQKQKNPKKKLKDSWDEEEEEEEEENTSIRRLKKL
jgi:predicted RNA-binding protein with PIN domain